MVIWSAPDVRSSEMTDESLYLRRREFLRLAALPLVGAAAAGVPLLGAAPEQDLIPGVQARTVQHRREADAVRRHHHLQQLLRVRHRQGVARANRRDAPDAARGRVTVDGEVRQAGRLQPRGHPQARIRSRSASTGMRCVEGWSMVIPWVGFPLGDFIKRVEPTSKAKFVEFTTLFDPAPDARAARAVLQWPYVEGLRLDEAMHPLDDSRGRALRRGRCRTRTARRCASSCRGSTASRASSRSCGSGSSRSSRSTPGSSTHPQRVRLLLEREPGGRSPALEPGERAPHRRVLQAEDADVQRLRRPGGVDVRGDGPAQELLTGLERLTGATS